MKKKYIKFLVSIIILLLSSCGNTKSKNVEILINEDFDIMYEVGTIEPDWTKGVFIKSGEENIEVSTDIIDSSNVNMNELGEYSVSYVIKGIENEILAKETVQIFIVDKVRPIFENVPTDLYIFSGTDVDLLSLGITALDSIGENISDKIKVDISDTKPLDIGNHHITYSVIDSHGNKSILEVDLFVVKKASSTMEITNIMTDTTVEVNDKISIRIALNNPTNKKIHSYRINGKRYLNLSKIPVGMFITEIDSGSDILTKSVVIESVNLMENGEVTKYNLSGKNSIDVTVFEPVTLKNITTDLDKNYVNIGDEVVFTFNFNNGPGYNIDSIMFGNQTYDSTDFLSNGHDKISISKSMHSINRVESIKLTNIKFSNESVNVDYEIKDNNIVNIFVGRTTQIKYISTPEELQNMDLNSINILNADIDLSDKKWMPIGDSSKRFKGYFDGNGFTINNLTISKVMNEESANEWGLFGFTDKSFINNVKLENTHINIENTNINVEIIKAGGLVGENAGGVITNSYATGEIYINSNNSNYSGGLIGLSKEGIISDSISQVNVTSVLSNSVNHNYSCVGGLIGGNIEGVISNSYAVGDVTSTATMNELNSQSFAGGLVGLNRFGVITNSHAKGNISSNSTSNKGNSTSYSGGLVGHSTNGVIKNSYAKGSVTGESSSEGTLVSWSYAGGLLGYAEDKTTIESSYSNSTVVSRGDHSSYAGGLVGLIHGDITNSYATGNVSSIIESDYNYSYAGGLVGEATQGRIYNCFAIGDVTSDAYNNSIGGLLGFGSMDVRDSFATGDLNVYGYTNIGGLLGQGHDNFANSYKFVNQAIIIHNAGSEIIDIEYEGVLTVGVSELNDEKWYVNTLSFDQSTWDFSKVVNGYYPVLLDMGIQEDFLIPSS